MGYFTVKSANLLCIKMEATCNTQPKILSLVSFNWNTNGTLASSFFRGRVLLVK